MPFVKNSRLNYFYIPAILFLAGFIIFYFVNLNDFSGQSEPNGSLWAAKLPAGYWGGAILSLFFLSLAIAFRGHTFLKGFSYTMMILAVVSLAMYYPASFKKVGGLESSSIIPYLLQLIMFGMGTELSLKDFATVLRAPKGVIIGIVCHYTIMPLVGFAVAHLFNFPGEVAAGRES